MDFGTVGSVSVELSHTGGRWVRASTRVTPSDQTSAAGEMVPRQNLVMSAYAFTANQLSDLNDVRLIAGPTYSTFTSAGGGWGVVVDGRVQYEVPAGGGGSYNSAPTPLPAPGATVALGAGVGPGSGGLLTALVPGVSSVAVWVQDKSGRWHQTQRIAVPLAPTSS